jgi:hypothetical protein
MLTGIKRLLGWILGLPIALLIALLVRFFERRLRFETRRDPAWRSHEQPPAPDLSEEAAATPHYT